MTDPSPPNLPRISVIVAMDEQGVIGKDNRLPWHLPKDLQHFKAITMGHMIVMGRHTYASLGRLLPGRTHLVMTRDAGFRAPGCHIAHSVTEAIQCIQAHEPEEAFIIGGAQIYAAWLPYMTRLYLTRVHATVKGDTYFPALDLSTWRLLSTETIPSDVAHNYAFSFVRLERDNSCK